MTTDPPKDEKDTITTGVTPTDVMNLPAVMKMIDEDIEWMQPMFDYSRERYDKEFRRYAPECPDQLDFNDDLRFKQAYLWFITEKVLPSIGRTALEEFVEKIVSPKEPEVAARMLLYGKVIRGPFRVVDVNHFPLILVEHLVSGKRYIAVSKIVDEGMLRNTFFPEGVVRGKIHPWWNGYYMFEGIISREMTYEERMSRDLGFIMDPESLLEGYNRAHMSRYESIRVNYGTTLRSSMNKYPFPWVDGMCTAAGIDTKVRTRRAEKIDALIYKLSGGYAKTLLEGKLIEQVVAIEFLHENGWIVRYGQLTRRFSYETGYWWNEQPPISDIGLLRLHGFVVVGKLPAQGRLYTVAVVPVEMRSFAEAAVLSRKVEHQES